MIRSGWGLARDAVGCDFEHSRVAGVTFDLDMIRYGRVGGSTWRNRVPPVKLGIGKDAGLRRSEQRMDDRVSPSGAQPHDRPLFGILCMNGAVALFVAMDAVIKTVSGAIPTGEIVFFRNAFVYLPILIFMARRAAGGFTLRTRDPLGHLARGIFGVASIYGFFLSYKLLPLSQAVALGLSVPLFITLLAIPLLREQVGLRRWLACIVGFIGVLIMTRHNVGTGDMELWQPATLLPIGAALTYALAMISVRRLSATESSGTIVFYFTAFATCAALASAPLAHWWPELAWVWPSREHWPLVVLIGVLGGCAQILLTVGYRHAPASIIAPFEYMALIYGFLFGFAVFGEIPDAALILGGILVVGSGLYILRREALAARAKRETPVPHPPA
jgi:drug/metabolite transporter (DMT)-like permease